jgi:DNA mismatch repair ATPase MutS
MTRPKLLFDPLLEPFMEIRGARHPCVATNGVNFIPNDILLGKINKYYKKKKKLNIN